MVGARVLFLDRVYPESHMDTSPSTLHNSAFVGPQHFSGQRLNGSDAENLSGSAQNSAHRLGTPEWPQAAGIRRRILKFPTLPVCAARLRRSVLLARLRNELRTVVVSVCVVFFDAFHGSTAVVLGSCCRPCKAKSCKAANLTRGFAPRSWMRTVGATTGIGIPNARAAAMRRNSQSLEAVSWWHAHSEMGAAADPAETILISLNIRHAVISWSTHKASHLFAHPAVYDHREATCKTRCPCTMHGCQSH